MTESMQQFSGNHNSDPRRDRADHVNWISPAEAADQQAAIDAYEEKKQKQKDKNEKIRNGFLNLLRGRHK